MGKCLPKIIVGCIALLSFAGPITAETPAGTLRGFVDFAVPTNHTIVDIQGDDVRIEADPAFGVSVFYEFRMAHRFGLELGLMFGAFDFKIKDVGGEPTDLLLAKARVSPLTLALNVHLLGKKTRPDLYIAPIVALHIWGDAQFPNTEAQAELDLDFGYGAVVGLDIPLGAKEWQLSLAARYLTMKADDSRDALAVDPLFVQVGVGFRY